MSMLGCLLGTSVASRSRAFTGASRAHWLALSAVAIGGTGTWVPHFMAMLGVDVPGTDVRYDILTTALGIGIAVVVYCLGLYLVGWGRPSARTILPAGFLTGIGLTAVFATGPLSMRLGGVVAYDTGTLLVAAVAAIVGATVVEAVEPDHVGGSAASARWFGSSQQTPTASTRARPSVHSAATPRAWPTYG